MGWFKKLTGISTKQALGAVATAGATYLTGNPAAGAAAGSVVSGGSGGILQNILGGAVGLGSDYLQAQINLAQQKNLAKYNAAQQTLLNQQAFDNNVKMWNMQNEYNTPTEQMKRLQAAGMNPNLVYGGGNVTGNTAGSAPQLEPARFDTGVYHPVDTRMERAQIALAMASQYQQVENQKIQNDLARQRLVLAERAADRADVALMLRNAKVNTGLTNKVQSDKSLDDEYKKLRNQRLKDDLDNPFKSGWAKDLYNQSKNAVDAVVSGVANVFRERAKSKYYHITGSGKNYVTFGRYH